MQPEEPSSLTEKVFARGNFPKCIPTSFFDKAPGTQCYLHISNFVPEFWLQNENCYKTLKVIYTWKE